MNLDPSRRPPYLDRRLDRWKLALLLCLFIILLLIALFWPDSALRVLGHTPGTQLLYAYFNIC